MPSFRSPLLTWRLCLLVLVPLLLPLALPTHAAPTPAQGRLIVDGTWRSETIDAESTGKWVRRGERMRIVFPKGVDGEFGLACAEPLPPGEWTIDGWFVQYDDLAYLDFSLAFGKGPDAFTIAIHPGSGRAEASVTRGRYQGGGYQNSGGGRIHWVRVVQQAPNKESATNWSSTTCTNRSAGNSSKSASRIAASPMPPGAWRPSISPTP
jgi:hypothetical protein